ncbi:hypothetical protein ABKN59_009017 [Abortiporus biennis]
MARQLPCSLLQRMDMGPLNAPSGYGRRDHPARHENQHTHYSYRSSPPRGSSQGPTTHLRAHSYQNSRESGSGMFKEQLHRDEHARHIRHPSHHLYRPAPPRDFQESKHHRMTSYPNSSNSTGAFGSIKSVYFISPKLPPHTEHSCDGRLDFVSVVQNFGGAVSGVDNQLRSVFGPARRVHGKSADMLRSYEHRMRGIRFPPEWYVAKEREIHEFLCDSYMDDSVENKDAEMKVENHTESFDGTKIEREHSIKVDILSPIIPSSACVAMTDVEEAIPVLSNLVPDIKNEELQDPAIHLPMTDPFHRQEFPVSEISLPFNTVSMTFVSSESSAIQYTQPSMPVSMSVSMDLGEEEVQEVVKDIVEVYTILTETSDSLSESPSPPVLEVPYPSPYVLRNDAQTGPTDLADIDVAFVEGAAETELIVAECFNLSELSKPHLEKHISEEDPYQVQAVSSLHVPSSSIPCSRWLSNTRSISQASARKATKMDRSYRPYEVLTRKNSELVSDVPGTLISQLFVGMVRKGRRVMGINTTPGSLSEPSSPSNSPASSFCSESDEVSSSTNTSVTSLNESEEIEKAVTSSSTSSGHSTSSEGYLEGLHTQDPENKPSPKHMRLIQILSQLDDHVRKVIQEIGSSLQEYIQAPDTKQSAKLIDGSFENHVASENMAPGSHQADSKSILNTAVEISPIMDIPEAK